MGANAQTTVPTFVAAQVLTAAQMNESARTGVPVFADTAARDAAFGGTGEKTLAEGQLCYLEDTNAIQFYDGAAWNTLSFGAPTVLKWLSGSTYLHPGKWNAGTTTTEDVTYYTPLYTPEAVTLDRIIFHTSSTFSGTATVRLGLYQSNSSGQPGTLILDAGTVSATASSTQYSVTISQTVPAGFFYLAFNSQTNAATNSYYGYSNAGSPEIASFFTLRKETTITALGQQIGYYQTGVSGSFANASITGQTGNVVTIAVRVA